MRQIKSRSTCVSQLQVRWFTSIYFQWSRIGRSSPSAFASARQSDQTRHSRAIVAHYETVTTFGYHETKFPASLDCGVHNYLRLRFVVLERSRTTYSRARVPHSLDWPKVGVHPRFSFAGTVWSSPETKVDIHQRRSPLNDQGHRSSANPNKDFQLVYQ